MSTAVLALTLLAAVLHATWNALLRSGQDRLWSVTIMGLATTTAALPAALLLPLPLHASWAYLLGSALLQVAYGVFLAYAYQSGELSEVYPIIRGSVPLLVTLGGFAIAGQSLSRFGLLGIALVSLGIMSLSVGRASVPARTLLLALTTALFIAAYVTIDGLGVRLAGSSLAYTAWIFLVYGLLMPVAFIAIRGRLTLNLRAPETLKAAAGGLISLVSYGAVVAALSLGKLGPVSALRETSVVFSALIGWALLGERLGVRRVCACLAIAAGAACVALRS